MEEDKPFGGPDQDFVFGEFAKAEYEVCRKQVVGIVCLLYTSDAADE